MIGISAAHRQMAKVLEKGCSRPVKRGRSHFSCFGLLVGTIWFKLTTEILFPTNNAACTTNRMLYIWYHTDPHEQQ